MKATDQVARHENAGHELLHILVVLLCYLSDRMFDSLINTTCFGVLFFKPRPTDLGLCFASVFYRVTACNATHCIARPFCLSVCLYVCLSVCPSVCMSNLGIVTKRKKLIPTFLHHMKDHSSWFSDKKKGWRGDPFYITFWARLILLEQNSRFSIDSRS